MTSVPLPMETGHHVVNELPMPPMLYGVVALVVFIGLLAFLLSFRNSLLLDPSEHHHDGDSTQDTGAGAGGAGERHH